MRNLTQHYSDEYLMGCIAKVGGNPHKCTANVQLSMTDNQWYLTIWQDCSTGWDDDERIIYSEPDAVPPVVSPHMPCADDLLPF